MDTKDALYGVEIKKVVLPLKPSLGVKLEEMARGKDGRGLVLVGELVDGGMIDAGTEYGSMDWRECIHSLPWLIPL